MATIDFKNLEAPLPNVPSSGLRSLPTPDLNEKWFSALYKMANSITGALNSFLPENKTIGFNVTSQLDLTNCFIDNFKGVRQSAISEKVVSEVHFSNQENDPIVKLRNKTNTGFFETIVSPTTLKINDEISFNPSTRTVKAVNFEGTSTKINISSTNSKIYPNLLFSINSNNNSAECGYGSNCQWDTQADSLLVNRINVSGVEVNEDAIIGTSARTDKMNLYYAGYEEFSCPILTKNVVQETNDYYSIIIHQDLSNHGSDGDFSQIEGRGLSLKFNGIMSNADTLKFAEVEQSDNQYFALLNEKTTYSKNLVRSAIKIGPNEVYADSFIGGTTDSCEKTEKIYLGTSTLYNTYYPIFGNSNGSFYAKANSAFKVSTSPANVTLSSELSGNAESTEKFSSAKIIKFKDNNKSFLSGSGRSNFVETTIPGNIQISSKLTTAFSDVGFTGYASRTNPINFGHSSFFTLMNVSRWGLDNKLVCFYVNVNGKSSFSPPNNRGFYHRGNSSIDTEYNFRLSKVETGKYCIVCERSVTDPDGTVHWTELDETDTYVRNVIMIPFD